MYVPLNTLSSLREISVIRLGLKPALLDTHAFELPISYYRIVHLEAHIYFFHLNNGMVIFQPPHSSLSDLWENLACQVSNAFEIMEATFYSFLSIMSPQCRIM